MIPGPTKLRSQDCANTSGLSSFDAKSRPIFTAYLTSLLPVDLIQYLRSRLGATMMIKMIQLLAAGTVRSDYETQTHM